MAHDIHEHDREGIAILDFKGRLTAGAEATALREKVAELNAAGKNKIVLNMAGVDYVDSTGLGSLVVCATSLRKGGGDLKMVNLNRRNVDLLVMTKLHTVFEVFTDEQDAVSSFYPDRKVKSFDILKFVQEQQAHKPDES